jgi:hypothetical protein
MAKAKRGRPPKPPAARKRNNLTIRVRDRLKADLEAQAADNQRSLSEEAENRLERSFDRQDLLAETLELAFGREAGGLGLAVIAIMNAEGRFAAHDKAQRAGIQREKMVPWIDDPHAYDQAMVAAVEMLKIVRPKGDPSAPHPRKEYEDHPELIANELTLSLQGKAFGWAEAVIGQSNFDAIKMMLGRIVERLQAGEYRLVRTGTGDKHAR